MLYHVPPAGTPVSLSDLFKSVYMRINNDCSQDTLIKSILERFSGQYATFLNSGRSALYTSLKALSAVKDPAKNEVVVPAYTCFSVAAAVAKSGLKIRLVDNDLLTMDYDYDKLENTQLQNVLAIVGCNLFGIPSNWNRLNEIAKAQKVYLIDDAAQAMGSVYDGKPLGSCGDIGFFSLGRGKNLSIYSGGILITDSERIWKSVSDLTPEINPSEKITEIKNFIKLVMYSVFVRPRLYWIPSRLPFLGIGKTVFDETFTVSDLEIVQKCLLELVFDRLDEFNLINRKNSKSVIDSISDNEAFAIPGSTNSETPSYLRLPLLCQSGQVRDEIIEKLNVKGISATSMYPSSIRQISGIEKYLSSKETNFPKAQKIVDCLLTLPVHSLLKEKDLETMISILEDYR
jgi:dTDP-4-amino-4,6-dideoxygalactose transaminase